ncbi:unnamed protein product [Vitrella brassicaformis CCMP3155]|uniref:Uncharacterized protein n=1 Tax=Vitrella brassicaformis (strain CCMP3155) TaxID=1169540 RepID=A0A0G4EC84_VITBC|nr:unnamed protein product [Vitrella brassicaformis CCMP3155]|eukprot:CEL92953.1 unnamed protein product [Vitrella brassicaformis CCMP3155]
MSASSGSGSETGGDDGKRDEAAAAAVKKKSTVADSYIRTLRRKSLGADLPVPLGALTGVGAVSQPAVVAVRAGLDKSAARRFSVGQPFMMPRLVESAGAAAGVPRTISIDTPMAVTHKEAGQAMLLEAGEAAQGEGEAARVYETQRSRTEPAAYVPVEQEAEAQEAAAAAGGAGGDQRVVERGIAPRQGAASIGPGEFEADIATGITKQGTHHFDNRPKHAADDDMGYSVPTLKHQVSFLEDVVADLESELERKDEEIESLKKKLTMTRADSMASITAARIGRQGMPPAAFEEEWDEMVQEIQDLREQLQEAEEEAAQYRDAAERASELIEELDNARDELGAARREKVTLARASEEVHKDLASLKMKLMDAHAEIKFLQESQAKEEGEGEVPLSARAPKSPRTNEDFEKMSQRLALMQESLQELERDNAVLKEKSSLLESENGELKAILDSQKKLLKRSEMGSTSSIISGKHTTLAGLGHGLHAVGEEEDASPASKKAATGRRANSRGGGGGDRYRSLGSELRAGRASFTSDASGEEGAPFMIAQFGQHMIKEEEKEPAEGEKKEEPKEPATQQEPAPAAAAAAAAAAAVLPEKEKPDEKEKVLATRFAAQEKRAAKAKARPSRLTWKSAVEEKKKKEEETQEVKPEKKAEKPPVDDKKQRERSAAAAMEIANLRREKNKYHTQVKDLQVENSRIKEEMDKLTKKQQKTPKTKKAPPKEGEPAVSEFGDEMEALQSEKAELEEKVAKLMEEMAKIKEEKDGLEEQVKTLEPERALLIEALARLRQINTDMQQLHNETVEMARQVDQLESHDTGARIIYSPPLRPTTSMPRIITHIRSPPPHLSLRRGQSLEPRCFTCCPPSPKSPPAAKHKKPQGASVCCAMSPRKEPPRVKGAAGAGVTRVGVGVVRSLSPPPPRARSPSPVTVPVVRSLSPPPPSHPHPPHTRVVIHQRPPVVMKAPLVKPPSVVAHPAHLPSPKMPPQQHPHPQQQQPPFRGPLPVHVPVPPPVRVSAHVLQRHHPFPHHPHPKSLMAKQQQGPAPLPLQQSPRHASMPALLSPIMPRAPSPTAMLMRRPSPPPPLAMQRGNDKAMAERVSREKERDTTTAAAKDKGGRGGGLSNCCT